MNIKIENKIITITILSLIFLSTNLVSAEINNFAPVKQGESIIIKQVCSSCSYVNLSISYPNSTLAITNKGMSNQGGGMWTYEFYSTSEIGRYDVQGSGDLSGIDTGFDILYFEVTANGNPAPDGIVILGFVIIMLVIFIFTIIYLIRAVGLIIEANFDILDIAYAWGLFFGLLGVNLLASLYLGNLEIQNFLELLIKLLAFPLVIVPVIAFFLSLFRTKKKQKEKEAQW